MQKIDTHVPPEIVTDDNLYETSIENLFETALTKTSDYNHFNELLVDFVKEVYHKKAFITNTIDYSKLEITNHYEMHDELFGQGASYNYTGMSLYKKEFIYPGNISVLCKIIPEHGKCGVHNFIVSKWDANNNFIEGSVQEFNLDQENLTYTFNVEVNSGDKIIVSKLNLDKTLNQTSTYNIDFSADLDLVSDFSSDAQYASTGQTVQFQNESSGNNITSYYWTFEGGTPSYSTDENPLVTYSTVGTYDVSLQVNEQEGETLTTTKENYMNIVGEGELVANFSANNSIINAGETVTFINQSLGEIDTYFWEFEGGYPETSNLENPQVSYSTSGLFDVRLTVTNTDGSRSMIKSNYMSVYDENSNDLICYADQLLDKTASFLVLYTGDHDPYDMTCTVDFGDQLYEDNESSMPPFDFLHTYQDYGTYEPKVSLEIRDLYDEIIFYGGCSCPVVSLVDPDPCGDFNVNITQTPSNPAYLDEETNEIEISYTGNVTGGVPPYYLHWAFLNDEYTGVSPVGGESGDIANTTNPTHNLGTITYNSNGIYRTFLHVMDGNSCTMDITRNQEIRSPDDCITDLRITYFQDYIQNQRLIIPWDDGNGNACLVNLRYEFLLNMNDNICSSCYNAEESSWWTYSNTESGKYFGEEMYLGQGGYASLYSDIDLSSQHDLSQGINYVRAKLQGLDYSDNNATSCYKQTTIRLIVLDCDSEMNTEDFLYNNEYTNSYSSTSGICLPANIFVEHNWREFIAGTIRLKGAANTAINEYDVMLSACNQVILEDGFETGEGQFVAQAGSIVKPCEQINYKKMSDEPEVIVNVRKSASMQVIPNPVGEMFNIKIHQPEEGQVVIKIFDAYGRLVETVFDQCISEGCYQIEVNNFNHKPGMYFCKYITNNTILTEKIIKTQNTYEF
jgi:PKD repeat protein